MDSWTLHGDSYSFLRSAPCTFSLCHRDGTPNHVEIFDIINIPTERSTISETTCLCDIFGVDSESLSLTSNPSVGAFVPSQRDVEATPAALPQVEDLNDSSGSYHTAQGSSEEEEGFEDSGERVYCPGKQNTLLEGRHLENNGQSQEHLLAFQGSGSYLEPKCVTVIHRPDSSPPLSVTSSSVTSTSHGLNRGESTRSPGCYSSSPLNPKGRLSSLPSSSADRLSFSSSPSSPGLKESYSEVEQRRITPSLTDRQSSPSDRSLTSLLSLPQDSPELRANPVSGHSSPSADLTQLSHNHTDSDLELITSHLFSLSGSESNSPLGDVLISPELRGTPPLFDAQAPSPFPELGGRVSLPDIFSRGSTPDFKESAQSTELISDLSSTGRSPTSTPESQDLTLSVERDSFIPTARPSPVISAHTSSVSPGIRSTSTSPGLVSQAPDPFASRENSSTLPEIRTPELLGVRHGSFFVDHRYIPPSPEIRTTAASPHTKIKEKQSRVKPGSQSHPSASPGSLTSSPHITGICCSIVPPEDRTSPPFPELQSNSLSSQMSKNRVESTGTAQHSIPSPVLLPEDNYLPQARNQTPSCQPNPLNPSSEPGHQTPASVEAQQSPSSQQRPRGPFPEACVSEQMYQQSPPTLSTKHNPLTFVSSTPEIKTIGFPGDVTQTQCPKNMDEDSMPPSFHSDRRVTEAWADLNISSPVGRCPSPTHVSSNKSLAGSLQHQATETEETRKKAHGQDRTSVAVSAEEQQGSRSPVLQSSKRELVSSVVRENRERVTQDVSRRGCRWRTPSPPLTRFTPVHIIAPEKPSRQWQKTSHSLPQVLSSSPSGRLKKGATNKESINVVPDDMNSQAHWVRAEKQLEMDREMLPKQGRDAVVKKKMDRGKDRKTEREEKAPGGGEGWQGVASSRGEQAELSFSARNRKGPVSESAAPTSSETSQGLPPARAYSESPPEKQQLQQQQSLLKASSQPDSSGGSTSKKRHPPASQSRGGAPRCSAASRPCRSSSSSMGSELDADNEVKWLTDVAFRSLSSPEVDYLDMHNSSHCSSTNISQPSTQESPAGVSAAWLAYADFRDSASKLDHDELSFQQPATHHSEGLDPSRRSELGSFECIDVSIDREDCRKVRRGVPKRQIQLKRRNNAERKKDEISGNSSPGVPAMVESPSQENHLRGSFVRQHSTPAAMQEWFPSRSSSELSQQQERQSNLQKSASMDETCCKTRMASCLIKNVLSKKMPSCDWQPDHAREEVSPPTECVAVMSGESLKPDSRDPSSSLHSDHSLSSERRPVREEPITTQPAKPKSSGASSSIQPSSCSGGRSVSFSQADREEPVPQSRNAKPQESESQSECNAAFQTKKSQTELRQTHKKEADLADATVWDTGSFSASSSSNTQTREANRDQERENTESDKCTSKTREDPSRAVEKTRAFLNVCLTPDADIKPRTFSPDVSLREQEENMKNKAEGEGPERDQAKSPIHRVRDVRRLVKNTYSLSFKAASATSPSNVQQEHVENLNEELKKHASAPDERAVIPGMRKEEEKERKEELWTERKADKKEKVEDSESLSAQNKTASLSGLQRMQIEYKAVCCKDEKNKTIRTQKSTQEVQSSNTSNLTTTSEPDADITAGTPRTVTETHNDSKDKPVVTGADQTPAMLRSPLKPPGKDREVSTAVVLIRDKPNTNNITASSTQEETFPSIQVPAPTSPRPTIPDSMFGSGGHSVSMLLKEKGYQADIGSVLSDNQNTAGAKGAPPKHVNCLEIPLQSALSSGEGLLESHREGAFPPSATTSEPSVEAESTDVPTKPREDEDASIKLQGKDTTKQELHTHQQTLPLAKQTHLGGFQSVRRIDLIFPPRSPAIKKLHPHSFEDKSPSKEAQKQEMPTGSTERHRPQTIELKSVSKNSQKPAVPPKPNCKFKPADTGSLSNEAQRTSATSSSPGKSQSEERPQTIVVSSPTVYRKISSEATLTSNYSRKLMVSAMSSLKSLPHRTVAAPDSSQSNQSAPATDTEGFSDQVQHQQPAVSPQSSRNHFKPSALATAPATDLAVTPDPSLVLDPELNQVCGVATSGAVNPDSQLQFSRAGCSQDQTKLHTSNNMKPLSGVSTAHVQRNARQPFNGSLSERVQRSDDRCFNASDDPPSYDERESFSPLLLPDVPPPRSNHYNASYRPAPCSCTAGRPTHFGHMSPLHHSSPHNISPSARSHSSGLTLPYQMSLPPLHPHQCRPDPQPINYQPISPKSSPLGPNQPPSMHQPLHQSVPCPLHPSFMQACSADRSLPPPQHIGPRRPPIHRSTHQQLPNISGTPYSDPGHSHSPGLQTIDPQYLCGPQPVGSSCGSDYGGDSSSLYSESSYGQTPRRVLMDPETGKYFYIEVPVQPLRKMLFDPETGQYVEVLIPHPAMSHSGLYPPSAVPVPPLQDLSMYAPAPQYMSCSAPPPLAYPQAQPQPHQYSDVAAVAMHPSRPGVSYRNPLGQGTKPDPPSHSPMDYSYLKNMYYVPTEMNASPISTPLDFYHKHPPNMPLTGGES
ncbi:streptococcal hemagglutinin [Nothobranchius furzeri]|uniref:Mucin-12-like n=1 Tax=Nothobranchius furzeri TaxID=105023 RepID=A0A9D3C6B4_NOTFU|nr:mucin-12-like [Nothobranchius furzeri]